MNNEPNLSVDDIDHAPADVPSERPSFDFDKFLDDFAVVADENFKLREENAKLNAALSEELSTARILNKLMEPSANKAFRFMYSYAGFVGLVVIFSGFRIRDFSMEPGVLGILVGSTAITVIGLVGMVLTGIFVGARKAAAKD